MNVLSYPRCGTACILLILLAGCGTEEPSPNAAARPSGDVDVVQDDSAGVARQNSTSSNGVDAPTEGVADAVTAESGDIAAPDAARTSDESTAQSATAPTGADTATGSDLANSDAAAGEGEVTEIVFEDIQLPIQQDMVFRPFMLTDRVRQLDGRKIRIHGYMLPDAKTKGITQFVLLKNTECKFGPGGQADHLINVLMVEGESTRFRDDPITVEGTLKINPFNGPDGNTWSIYDLSCERVESYRPRR